MLFGFLSQHPDNRETGYSNVLHHHHHQDLFTYFPITAIFLIRTSLSISIGSNEENNNGECGSSSTRPIASTYILKSFLFPSVSYSFSFLLFCLLFTFLIQFSRLLSLYLSSSSFDGCNHK